MSRASTFITTVTALLVVIAIGVAGYQWLTQGNVPGRSAGGSGEALVGGPFALTSHTGERMSNQDFRGRYMLIYFGYTFCPDVCPTELQVMTAAVEQLGEKAETVRPILITVDPERDSVEQLALYIPNFGARLIGLTGTPEEIAAVTKAYRVYSAKVEDEASSEDYLMDHTSLVYLMGPDGAFRRVFSYGTSAEEMARGISEELADSG